MSPLVYSVNMCIYACVPVSEKSVSVCTYVSMCTYISPLVNSVVVCVALTVSRLDFLDLFVGVRGARVERGVPLLGHGAAPHRVPAKPAPALTS